MESEFLYVVEVEEGGSHSPMLLQELDSLETQILPESKYVTWIPSIFPKISNILCYVFIVDKSKCNKNKLLLRINNYITKLVTYAFPWDSQTTL